MVPSLIRLVRAAAKASALYPSSISCEAGPTPGIWKKWSMTHTLNKPARSARWAIKPNVSPSDPCLLGQVKLVTCNPIRIKHILLYEYPNHISPSLRDRSCARDVRGTEPLVL